MRRKKSEICYINRKRKYLMMSKDRFLFFLYIKKNKTTTTKRKSIITGKKKKRTRNKKDFLIFLLLFSLSLSLFRYLIALFLSNELTCSKRQRKTIHIFILFFDLRMYSRWFYFVINLSYFISVYSNTSSISRSARRTGNITLGGLFPVHEYGSPREPCGAISEFRGIQRLEAMLFAIEQINNQHDLLPKIDLGALILDTCSDDNYALEQSLGFVLSRLTSSSCKCANTSHSETSMSNDNVFGVVGATLSSVSVHVANLLRLFQLPQISYASTTPKLSEPSFEYFARTVPSDSNQARAIVDILHRLNFTYVNTIYSHGDYGEGGFREFRRLIKISTTTDDEMNSTKKKQIRICIADEQRLHRDATIADIKQILQTMLDRLKSDVQVRVYVLFVTKEDARKLLQAIKLFNGTHRPVLIASDAWVRTMNKNSKNNRIQSFREKNHRLLSMVKPMRSLSVHLR